MFDTKSRKRIHIDTILKAHPLYAPEAALSQRAAKALERLPLDVLLYLGLLAEAYSEKRERRPV